LTNNTQVSEYASQLNKWMPVDRILINESMQAHTTFAVGGPADILVLPQSMEELAEAIRIAETMDIPVTVLGGGSNVLVLDGGIRGAVIQLNDMRPILRTEGSHVIASAGYMLKDVCQFALQQGLTGIEFACGIPGTLGGAVFMNAGAYGGEMSHVVHGVTTVDYDGNLHFYHRDSLIFAYRHSLFQDSREVIGEINLALTAGNREDIKAVMDDLTQRRESKQPLDMHSAGSTFKRPPGHFAGTLIEQTGLKGLAVGDAQVSRKHAGFVVNTGHAEAKDILALIREVQRRVEEAHGVHLEPEVRIIGEA
jgi:UDP-N-acetylmuramate dehydrogenase